MRKLPFASRVITAFVPVLVICFTSIVSAAQATVTVSGVVNIPSGPVEGVTVTLDNGASYTTTDAAGAYSLNASTGADHILGIYKPGFNFIPSRAVLQNVQAPQVVDFTLGSRSCVAPAPGIVAWWKAGFDTSDSIGTNYGSMPNGINNVAGLVGDAFDFDGFDDYFITLNASRLNFEAGDDFTIMAWVRRTAGGSGDAAEAVFDKYDLGADLGYKLWLIGGVPHFQMSDGNTITNISGDSIDDGDWHLITVQRAGSTMRIYTDRSVQESAGAPQGSLFNLTGFSFGDDPDLLGQVRFKGQIDDTQVYRRALRADEVKAVVDAGSDGLCTNLPWTGAGTPDITLAGRGTTPDFMTSDGGANAVAIQPDGKIVAVGSTDSSTQSPTLTVARYETDGQADLAFNNGAPVVLPQLGGAVATAVAIQPDGRIVVGGQSQSHMVVIRFNTDGTLDQNFGTAGVSDVVQVADDSLAAVALQPDGKIIAAGTTNSVNDSDFLFFRYTANGQFDTSFGDGTGKTVVSFGPESDNLRGAKILADGKIVAAARPAPTSRSRGLTRTAPSTRRSGRTVKQGTTCQATTITLRRLRFRPTAR